ncbi:CBN-HRP-1 protein [Aphelenchoides besseyi]|nr:CBN-HRP-1 protein [Aphelenchoides besseyi]
MMASNVESSETKTDQCVEVNSNSSEQPAKLNNDDERLCKIFIGGLATETVKESLRDYYSQFGEVVDSVVMYDLYTQRSRCFGFITFANKEAVDEAMNHRPHIIDDKKVDAKRAVPRSEQTLRGETNVSTNRLYVCGITEQLSEETLRDYFNKFGHVEKVSWILIGLEFKISDEYCSGQAYRKTSWFRIHFDSVDKCVLYNKFHNIDNHQCEVRKGLSREQIARAEQVNRDRVERYSRTRNFRYSAAGPWREAHDYKATWNRPADFNAQWYGTNSWQPDSSNYAIIYSQNPIAGYSSYNGGWSRAPWTNDTSIECQHNSSSNSTSVPDRNNDFSSNN